MECDRVIWSPNLNLYAPWLHKKIAKGCGIGVGKDYVPWIKTRDFSSKGTSGQTHSMLTDRVIHTLSEYETIYFYILERDHSVIDIREQFPILNLPETIEIAFNLGYKHPTKYGKPDPITIDFLITIQTQTGIKFAARSIKTPEDINVPNVRLRLKIEEIWCDKYQIDWANVDTSSFTKEMLAALRSIRSWYRNGLIIDNEFADLFAKAFLKVYERNVPLNHMLTYLKRKFAINDNSEYDWFNYCAWSKRIPLSIHHISTINDVVILDKYETT